MSDLPPVAVKVWGDYACFTRPEMKVERVTYPVPTPSAARGILEAIFWKPQFAWQVRSIEVLRPIRRISLLRNEVKRKVALSTAKKPGNRYFADDDRTQRHTLALRDVAYVIRADMAVVEDEHPAKYRDQFRRRVARGQCFHRPYLGCREFTAHFAEPDGTEQPIDLAEDLGRMLFDMRYGGDGDRIEPVFFNARIEHGVITVPQEHYAQAGGSVC
ncbi:MAG: type I-C CRISPR-associated protein Cas5c [Candidatus Brocadiia bacterium]